MEDRVYIQWTIINWVTVFLMATLGFLMMGAIAQAAHNMSIGRMKDRDGASN